MSIVPVLCECASPHLCHLSLQSQFRFVCEAIHRVYTEELVKPLAEYQQR